VQLSASDKIATALDTLAISLRVEKRAT